jgi:uncharacterized protein (TIGR00303 family)
MTCSISPLPMITIHTQSEIGRDWITCYQGQRPHFACVLGFTETGLLPGISAAGLTPADRRYTALADGEFLARGVVSSYKYSLPPLMAGASPAIITRAIAQALNIPVTLLNAGLPEAPSFDCVDLGGQPAACLSTGRAMAIKTVQHLWQQGLIWGEQLASQSDYLVIGECVVGGTTTAQAILTALGYPAAGKINSSHPQCNHDQKRLLVEQGLAQADLDDPWQIVAAVGDPMQIVVAAMTIAARRHSGVLLAGGTQMLAVYALARALSGGDPEDWDGVAIGTTGWVAKDPSGDTVGLAKSIAGACLISAELQFKTSTMTQFQVYDRGFVKEGVGAGGSAIAAHLYGHWQNPEILQASEALLRAYLSSGAV